MKCKNISAFQEKNWKKKKTRKATKQFIIILNSLFSKLMQFFQQASEVKENKQKFRKYLFWNELIRNPNWTETKCNLYKLHGKRHELKSRWWQKKHTVVLNSNVTSLHKYYKNRVRLNQEWTPEKRYYAFFIYLQTDISQCFQMSYYLKSEDEK